MKNKLSQLDGKKQLILCQKNAEVNRQAKV
jgi:hypothetical protein